MSVAVDSSAPRTPFSVARDLIALTKPRIILLLLVTTYAAMLIADPEAVTWPLVLFTLLGGTLTSGSANAINMVYDRDIDAIMKRTRRRPLPSGRLSPAPALIFAIVLGLLGAAVLWFKVNPLASALAVAGNLFYVFVYTMWLKRTSVQNIVIGGAAGAVPPMVGWVAVTGNLDLAAVIMFLIIFLWTPPHFWALAFYKNDDYRAAGVPMLPVVHGNDATVRQILLYTALLVPSSLLLALFHPMTIFYVLAALILGGVFAWYAVRLARTRTDVDAKRLFANSLVYLALIFAAMVFDRVLLADYLQPVVPQAGVNGYPVIHTRTLQVEFTAGVAEGLPLKVEVLRPKLQTHPNEPKQLAYRITNLSDRSLTVMADHALTPEQAGGFYKKIECFCFKEQHLAPGETADLPLQFAFVDALPQEIDNITVHYGFKEIVEEGGEAESDHHGHAH